MMLQIELEEKERTHFREANRGNFEGAFCHPIYTRSAVKVGAVPTRMECSCEQHFGQQAVSERHGAFAQCRHGDGVPPIQAIPCVQQHAYCDLIAMTFPCG